MAAVVQITVNAPEVLTALNRLVMSAGDTHAVLDQIGAGEVENTRLRFAMQEDPDGNPWVPSIRARVQGGQTLRDTGALMNSITHRVMGASVEVGTSLLYARMMQQGGTVRAKGSGYLRFRVGGAWARKRAVTIPARPFLGVDADGEQQVLDIVNHFLQEQLK